MDLSPWTDFYQLPATTLYSAAQVLVTIPPQSQLIKIDLKSGFFHFAIKKQHQPYYGVYYRGQRYALTRLPMGHPLAPSIMQRASIAVASHLHSSFRVQMCAYLDDWLIWDLRQHPIPRIVKAISNLGFTINQQKSTLQPSTRLVYLGLTIDTNARSITPTSACLRHLRQLIAIVPAASQQDLRRIAGYVAWLAWAMAWPQFISSQVRQRDTYWLRVLDDHHVFHQPRQMVSPERTAVIHTDATPSTIAAITPPPVSAFFRHLEPPQPIAVAEMAAALIGLHWYAQNVLQHPTTIHLHTDSSIVYYSLVRGTGVTLRYTPVLQNLYIAWLINKVYTGHGLVVHWVPSHLNLADPLSRGVHALQQGAARL
jgi:hypothetical protein